jgi:hypothetical protein
MRIRVVFQVCLIAILEVAAVPASAAEAKNACPDGQISVKGACRPACATKGTFAEPDACECPPGFGKVLTGNGGGQCLRLQCGLGVNIDPKLCDCPKGYAPKAVKGGTQCLSAKPKDQPAATAKPPPAK